MIFSKIIYQLSGIVKIFRFIEEQHPTNYYPYSSETAQKKKKKPRSSAWRSTKSIIILHSRMVFATVTQGEKMQSSVECERNQKSW